MPTQQLIGVGVGPGEPELITLKALHALKDADVILVPTTEASTDRPGRAEQIVCAVLPDAGARMIRVPFSMSDRSGVTEKRKEAWLASADAAVTAFGEGATVVAFATIGDPSVYSTFSYLAAHVLDQIPELQVWVIPGITAMQALAAATNLPLVEGRECLTLAPATAGDERLAELMKVSDTLVIYKSGRTMQRVKSLLETSGRAAVLGSDVGLPEQQICLLDEVEGSLGYMSTLISTRPRLKTGGQL